MKSSMLIFFFCCKNGKLLQCKSPSHFYFISIYFIYLFIFFFDKKLAVLFLSYLLSRSETGIAFPVLSSSAAVRVLRSGHFLKNYKG